MKRKKRKTGTRKYDKELGCILKRYSPEKGQLALIPLLQEVQDVCGYIPPEAVGKIGEHLNVPLSHIYGVVTFYAQFSLVPRGRNIIKVCAGTACHIKGVKRVLDAIKSTLDIKENETTSDLKFSLEVVRCLGTCFLAPVIMINQDYYGMLTAEKVKQILKRYK